MSARSAGPIDGLGFYGRYDGHPIDDLRRLVHTRPSDRPAIFLAGDSTLDNKYWIARHREKHPDPHIRSQLDAAHPIARDVAYWLSRKCRDDFLVLNCAIEASTLRSRLGGKRLPSQDALIRDALRPNDVLVVSAGGNDIALAPTLRNAVATLGNVFLGGDVGMSTLRAIFKDGLQDYIASLTSVTRPRLVVLCMLYFPDENADVVSWASPILRAMLYNSRPLWTQDAMRRVYDRAVRQVRVEPPSELRLAPLFDALDGSSSQLYVARVEPSEAGADAIASLLWRTVSAAVSAAP